jgi:hypothetical protein
MGTWGIEPFENDSACDWSYGLEETEDLSLVREALSNVLEEADDYLDADLAVEALAACEVIARLKGCGGRRDPFTEAVDQWVEAHPQPVPTGVVASAVAAIDRILSGPSELLDLWREGGDFNTWLASVRELQRRVQGESLPPSCGTDDLN